MNNDRTKQVMSNEKVLLFILVISSIATLVIISIGTVFLRNKVDDLPLVSDKKEKDYEAYYVLIVKNTTDPFWQSVYEAAREEGAKNNIYVELLGADLLKDYSVADKLKMALASKVDGIIVVPEGEDIADLLNEADQMAIPVVTLLSDTLKGNRKSFVGVNSGDIAKLYCNEIHKMSTPAQHVMILIDDKEQMSNKNMIYLSLKEALEKEGLSVEVKPIDRTNAFSAEETIRDMVLRSKMMPDVLICLNMEDTLCAYQAIIDYNKVGEMGIIGYYQSDTILEGIEKGIINATVFVDTQQMGKQGVQALCHYEKNKQVNAYFTVDINVINRQNVEEYIHLE